MQPNEYTSGVSPVCGEATVSKSDRHGRSPRGRLSTCVRLAVTRSRFIAHHSLFHFSAATMVRFRSVDAGGIDPDMLGTTRRS